MKVRRKYWVVAWCAMVSWSGVAAVQQPPTRQQTYRLEQGPGDVQALHARFGPDQIGILEALNLADAAHLPTLKEIVASGSWHADSRAYSPFPSRIGMRGFDVGRVLIVHQPGQAFAPYENGQLVTWGPVSTGRALSPTPQGLFHSTWRSPGRPSTVNPRCFLPWYFKFQNHRGLSFHEYALPGRPASHACVRLLERDARWLYEWGQGWTLDDRGGRFSHAAHPCSLSTATFFPTRLSGDGWRGWRWALTCRRVQVCWNGRVQVSQTTERDDAAARPVVHDENGVEL